MNNVIKIEGLDCANCARELEEEIEKIEGVQSASVDFLGQKVRVACDERTLERVIDCCNHFEEVKVVSAEAPVSAEVPVSAPPQMQNAVIKIAGLDCANCARELEEEIEKIEGVQSASVDFLGQKVRVACDERTLERVIDCCNHFEEVKVVSAEKVGQANGGAKQGAEALRPSGKKLKIEGLCCANCGRELEEELNKISGITATVDFMNKQIVLNSQSAAAYEEAVYTISHFEEVKIVDGAKEPQKSVWRAHMREILEICVGAVLFIPAILFTLLHLEGGWEIASYVLYGCAYLAVGYRVLINTAKNIAKGKIFDENFLMTIASIGAILLGIFTGDGLFEGVAVMLLYQIGELFQSIAVGSSRRSITQLMDLKSEFATLLANGEQVTVSPEDLKAGDTVLVKAGEKIPADGVIIKGESALDLKSLNGESVPREVKEGDEVLSGSINVSGVLEVKIIREYKNSAVAKILDLVENSTAKKAAPEKFITKFAKYYTPLVCLAAAIVAGVVPTVICAVQGAFGWPTYADWIYKALSFLVISCPCALVISVPLSYFGGIGRAAKFGVLVKGSTCLDELAAATVAAFDKTGTITQGSFAVVNSSSERALQLAAAAEKFSSHPIAAAFNGVQTPYAAEDAEEIAGRGVICKLDDKELLCGNGKLMAEKGVAVEEIDSLSTLIYVALDGEYIGYIEIDDAVKSGAREALQALKSQGVKSCVMLTGDNPQRAEKVAAEVGLDGYKGGLMPDGKLAEALSLKEKGKLVYVGDGINDAPVMTAADCAVSMGQVGSDAAIEASDIVLVSDNLALLPKAKKIAKGTKKIVYQNIVGSLLVKFAIMALSIAVPEFPLIVAIFGDVGVMLLAVLNAMRTGLID